MASVPIHAAAHLRGFGHGFLESLEDGYGIDVLARGVGGTLEDRHGSFGIFCGL